ncbi:hypothetical protein B0H13DRAFT_1860598 [Mycena leptocephala]|nr:hypothetical protein B0H13DRAFT_1860598 [Mycena leptocephala]
MYVEQPINEFQPIFQMWFRESETNFGSLQWLSNGTEHGETQAPYIIPGNYLPVSALGILWWWILKCPQASMMALTPPRAAVPGPIPSDVLTKPETPQCWLDSSRDTSHLLGPRYGANQHVQGSSLESNGLESSLWETSGINMSRL